MGEKEQSGHARLILTVYGERISARATFVLGVVVKTIKLINQALVQENPTIDSHLSRLPW